MQLENAIRKEKMKRNLNGIIVGARTDGVDTTAVSIPNPEGTYTPKVVHTRVPPIAGRMLKNISVPMIGRCTRAALHANVPHPTLPLQNRLTKKRRYRKAQPRIILNHHE